MCEFYGASLLVAVCMHAHPRLRVHVRVRVRVRVRGVVEGIGRERTPGLMSRIFSLNPRTKP